MPSYTAVTLLGLASSALAFNANVVNHCTNSVVVQPNGGQQQQLAPGGTYTEQFRPAAAIYISDTPENLAHPLTFEYNEWTAGDGHAVLSYDLSNNAGNPVGNQRNTLTTGNGACAHVDCAPGDASCYSNGANPKVLSCDPTDLTVTLCA